MGSREGVPDFFSQVNVSRPIRDALDDLRDCSNREGIITDMGSGYFVAMNERDPTETLAIMVEVAEEKSR